MNEGQVSGIAIAHPNGRFQASADLHALPEGDTAADIFRFSFRIRIVSGSVEVVGTVDLKAMIMSRSLPRANGSSVARSE